MSPTEREEYIERISYDFDPGELEDDLPKFTKGQQRILRACFHGDVPLQKLVFAIRRSRRKKRYAEVSLWKELLHIYMCREYSSVFKTHTSTTKVEILPGSYQFHKGFGISLPLPPPLPHPDLFEEYGRSPEHA